MKTYKFKRGQKVHLDEIYDFLGIIPLDAYQQHDPSNSPGCDEEIVMFKKNVEIKYSVKVT